VHPNWSNFSPGRVAWPLDRPKSLRELGAEAVVPVVGDLGDGFQEILELFVVEPGEPSKRANDDLVSLGIDCKRRIRGREKGELEQPSIQSLVSRQGHGHDGRDEQENAVVFEYVHADRRRSFADLRVAAGIERFRGALGARAETREIRVHHRAGAGIRLAGGAVRVYGFGRHVVLLQRAASAPTSRKNPFYGYTQGSGGRQRARIASVLTAFALFACKRDTAGPGKGEDATERNEEDIAFRTAIAEGRAELPARPQLKAISRATEALATREGSGARATALYTAAGRLLERLWRLEGHAEDGREAIDLYDQASRGVHAAGACEAALAGAQLTGDVARDPTAAYAELHRAERRFAWAAEADAGAVSSCRRSLEDRLALLAAFRPDRAALDAIDDQLVGEGTLASAAPSDAAAPSGPPRITRVEGWSGPEAARVVVALDRPTPYRIGDDVPTGGADPRTFLDFDGVELGPIQNDLPSQGIVPRIGAEATTTGSRVWLQFDGHVWRRVFEMQEPYRVVIDVARRPPGIRGNGPRTLSRVVLDPGHGGSDRGARGPTGLAEKDVVLDIARRVAPVLAGQGIQVMLTREDDRFVSLEERTARANAFGADLFVSIHCNASEGRVRRGIESYVLDTSRDEVAARVAARENATTQPASAELASILGGLRMAEGSGRSRRLAELLLRASTTAVQSKYGDAVDGGVHAAGFYVLVGARMPAVLFEASYISNATDEQRLAGGEYRQLLADAIANALRAFREGR